MGKLEEDRNGGEFFFGRLEEDEFKMMWIFNYYESAKVSLILL